MINDQLLSYIKQQLAKNVQKEIIANNLKSQGWTDADLNEAFSAIAPSIPATSAPMAPLAPGAVPNINPTQVQAPIMQSVENFSNLKPHKSKKALLIISILILLGAGSASGYFFYLKQTPVVLPETENIEVNQEVNETSNQTSAEENPGIIRVTVIMADICQGYITNNNSLIVDHASKETASFISGAKMDKASECIVNKIYKYNENIVVNVTLSVPEPGKPSNEPSIIQDMVFIKEENDWKLDLAASAKFAMDQNNAKEGIDAQLSDAGIKTDLSSLLAVGNFFKNQNNGNGYSGLCLFNGLKIARASIEDHGGTGFVCKDSPTKYAIGVKLSQSSGYWCVDSTGANKATATSPSSTACPVK